MFKNCNFCGIHCKHKITGMNSSSQTSNSCSYAYSKAGSRGPLSQQFWAAKWWPRKQLINKWNQNYTLNIHCSHHPIKLPAGSSSLRRNSKPSWGMRLWSRNSRNNKESVWRCFPKTWEPEARVWKRRQNSILNGRILVKRRSSLKN